MVQLDATNVVAWINNRQRKRKENDNRSSHYPR